MKTLIPLSAISFLLLLTILLDCPALTLTMTKEELILESQEVIHGIVKEVNCKWNEDHSMIYTYVTFQVIEVFKGASRNEIIIQIRGGSLDNKGVWVEDEPEFEEGDKGKEIIVHTFLRENGYYGIYGGARGAYIINNGMIEKLNMTPDQFKNLVNELTNREKDKTQSTEH